MWPLIKPKVRHLVALLIFLPLLLLGLYLFAKNTDAYEEAVRFVTQDARVAALIGPVKRTDLKFWEGFVFTGSNANFSIEATGDKGTFVVDVHLHCVTNVWRVEAADIRGQSKTLIRTVVN